MSSAHGPGALARAESPPTFRHGHHRPVGRADVVVIEPGPPQSGFRLIDTVVAANKRTLIKITTLAPPPYTPAPPPRPRQLHRHLLPQPRPRVHPRHRPPVHTHSRLQRARTEKTDTHAPPPPPPPLPCRYPASTRPPMTRRPHRRHRRHRQHHCTTPPAPAASPRSPPSPAASLPTPPPPTVPPKRSATAPARTASPIPTCLPTTHINTSATSPPRIPPLEYPAACPPPHAHPGKDPRHRPRYYHQHYPSNNRLVVCSMPTHQPAPSTPTARPATYASTIIFRIAMHPSYRHSRGSGVAGPKNPPAGRVWLFLISKLRQFPPTLNDYHTTKSVVSPR